MCVRANHAFNAHLSGAKQQFASVGIILFVNLQGCGRPQIADEQKVDTHVFRCVVKGIRIEMPELGCHKAMTFR